MGVVLPWKQGSSTDVQQQSLFNIIHLSSAIRIFLINSKEILILSHLRPCVTHLQYCSEWNREPSEGRCSQAKPKDGAQLLTLLGRPSLLGRKTNLLKVVQTWLFGIFAQYCLKNKQSEIATLRGTSNHVVIDDKICDLMWQFKFSKSCINHCEHDKRFSYENGSDANKYEFSVLYFEVLSVLRRYKQ